MFANPTIELGSFKFELGKIPTNMLNAQAYGAKGDGVTSDSAALTAAAEAAITMGLPLYIPKTPACYMIDSQIAPSAGNLTIVSDGATLRVKANTVTRVFYFHGISNITVRGLRLDGNKANQAYSGSTTQALVYIYLGTRIIFDRCEFVDGISSHIYAAGENFTDQVVSNLVLTDCFLSGSYKDTLTIRKYVDGLKVHNCVFDTWGDGVNSNKAVSIQASRDVVITQTRFRNTTANADAGIVLEHDNALVAAEKETDGAFIAGCYFEGMAYSGIKADDCRNIVIRDCYIKDTSNKGTSLGMGIWLAGVINVLVEGCVIRDIDSAGVYVVKGGDTHRRAQHVRIRSNVIDTCTDQGVWADSFAGLLVEGNSIKSCGRSITIVDGTLGASDHYIIRNNLLQTNALALDDAATGINKDVSNNLAY